MTNYRDRFQNGGSKNLNTKKDNSRLLLPQNEKEYASEAESERFVKAYYKQKSRYIPEIDYKDPSTFSFFGSAEKYYEDSIKNITSAYPYDGSRAEKMEWSLSASYLDLYLLEHEYPKEVGSIDFVRTSITNSTGYVTVQTPKYIKFFGGPQKNTIYNSSKKRESNIKIDGTTGNTIEFWLKKDPASYLATDKREVILDINSSNTSTSSNNFGRLTVELRSHNTKTNLSPFYLTYRSGSTGTSLPASSATAYGVRLGTSGKVTCNSVADGKWHHYIITAKTEGSNTVYKFYVDGELDFTTTENYTIGPVSTFLSGTIGASTENGAATTMGQGQLSASLDELRIWKTARTEKELGRFWYSPVHGGTDNDHTNADLGLYYKFNEGITGVQSADKVVLDYSGRINNGEIVNWDSGFKSSDSAITLSENIPEEGFVELGDPVINPENAKVTALQDSLREIARSHDVSNLSSLRNSVPQHFTDTDNSLFLDLLQIMSSAFDDIFIKIKNLPKMKDFSYQEFFEEKGNYKQDQSSQFLLGCEDLTSKDFTGHHTKPWVSNILEHFGIVSSDIFQDASMFERFFSRTEEVTFEYDLEEVKRLILANIHKNLVHILKTKGTESSFRNLIRCFGVDDEIVKLNAYGDNEEYELVTKPIYTTVKHKSLNFEGQNYQGTIYHKAPGSDADARGFITGSSTKTPFTMEGNFIFPKYKLNTSVATTNSSLFGMHSINDNADETGTLTFRTGAASPAVGSISTTSGTPSMYDDSRIRITNTAGTSKTFLFDSTNTEGSTGHVDEYGNIIVQVSSLGSTEDIAEQLKEAINSVSGFNISAVRGTGSNSDKVTLTQDVAGLDGNRDIEDLDHIMGLGVENFQNGADGAGDDASFQVKAIKRVFNEPDAYFQLSSSAGVITPINSQYFPNVYDNQHWNLAVKIGKKEAIDFNVVTPSEYFVEFSGYNYDLDVLKNSFSVTAPISATAYDKISQQNKAVFVGTHRTNFTGSVLTSTDVRVLGFNTWKDILTDEELKEHAQNPKVFGRKAPQSISNFDTGNNLMSLDSLLFRWQFEQHVSASSGQMVIEDMSSGMAGSELGYKYTGQATGLVNDPEAIAQEFLPGVEYFGPDNSYSSDRVKIKNTELDKFKADSKPVTYNFAFEKSMYQIISREMVNFFAGIVGFGNIIGEPVNKYRRKYKLLEKIRNRFFMRVNNEPDIDKFIEYYKWIDSSLSTFLSQLIPASSFLDSGIKDVVESHVLERNKYEHKAPTVEFKDPSENIHPILGVNELLYDWEHGHAPAPLPVSEVLDIKSDVDGGVFIADDGEVFDFLESGANRSITIALWAHIAEDQGGELQYLAAKMTSTSNAAFSILIDSNNRIKFTHWDADTTSSNVRTLSGITLGQWNHFVFTIDKTTSANQEKIYINGNLIRQETTETDMDTSKNATAALYIGSALSGFGYPFHGQISNFVFFKHGSSQAPLTAAQVTELYSGGYVSDYNEHSRGSDIVAWYKLENNTLDSSVHNRHASSDTSTSFASPDSPLNFLMSDDSNVNCLWQKERSEVEASRQVIKRITHTEVSGSTYATRRLVKPYKFTADNVVVSKAGFNRDANKNIEMYKAINSGASISLKSSELTTLECSDKIEPTRKRMYKGKTDTTGIDGYLDGDSDLILPFNLVSSSAGTDFPGLKSGVRIANNHLDYDVTGEKSLRGPFGETHIGGMPHNKVRLGTAETERPEAYSLNIDTGTKTLTVGSIAATTGSKSMFFRDSPGTRFANVSNIRHDTSSLVLGNYNKDYEIVMTAGRGTNNDHFVNNEGSWVGVFTAPQDNGLTDIVNYSVPDRGRTDHVIVNRFSAPGSPESQGSFAMDSESEEYSIYNTMNYRNLLVRDMLNRLHAEHSDQLGYRRGTTASATVTIANNSNLSAGDTVNIELSDGTTIIATVHNSNTSTNNTNTPVFKKDSGNNTTATNLANCLNANSRLIASANGAEVTITLNDISDTSNPATITLTESDTSLGMSKTDFVVNSTTQASLHMTNRNPFRTTGSLGRQVDYGNAHIQRSIPTNDFGYSWITASANEDVYSFLNKNENFGYQHAFGPLKGTLRSEQSLSFVSSSQLEPNLDFVYGNFQANTEITPASNLVSYSNTALNSQILNKQGPYGWPTWKQIRGYEHPISRYERKNAKISLVIGTQAELGGTYLFPPTFQEYEWSTNPNLSNLDFVGSPAIEKKVEVFDEVMATNRFNPLTITFHGSQARDLTVNPISQTLMESYWNNDETSLVALEEEAANLAQFPGIQTRLASLKISTGNQETMFSNYSLMDRLELEDVRLPGKVIDIMERLGEMPLEQEEIFATEINYIETLYPREVNTFTKEARIRESFDFYSWRDNREDRAVILTGSIINHVGSETNLGILANRLGASFSFDGTNDYVEVADNDMLTPLTSSITNVPSRNFSGAGSRASVADHDNFTFIKSLDTNIAVSTFDQSPSAEYFQIADNNALSFSQANDSNVMVKSFLKGTDTHIIDNNDSADLVFVEQSSPQPITELDFNGSSSKIVLNANTDLSFVNETTITENTTHHRFNDASATSLNVSDNDLYSYVTSSGTAVNSNYPLFQGYFNTSHRGLLRASPSSVTGNTKGYSMVDNAASGFEADYSIGFWIKPNNHSSYGEMTAGASAKAILTKSTQATGNDGLGNPQYTTTDFEWMIHQHDRDLVFEQKCGITGVRSRWNATDILDNASGATSDWQHIGFTYNRPNSNAHGGGFATQDIEITDRDDLVGVGEAPGHVDVIRIRKAIDTNDFFKVTFTGSLNEASSTWNSSTSTLTVGISGASQTSTVASRIKSRIEHFASSIGNIRFDITRDGSTLTFKMLDRGPITGFHNDMNTSSGDILYFNTLLDGTNSASGYDIKNITNGSFPTVKWYKNGTLHATQNAPTSHSGTQYKYQRMVADTHSLAPFIVANGPQMTSANSWAGRLSNLCMWKHGGDTVTVSGVDHVQSTSPLSAQSWKRIYNDGFLFDYQEELNYPSIVAYYKFDTDDSSSSDAQPDATGKSNSLNSYSGSGDSRIDVAPGAQESHYIKVKPKQLKSFTKAFWIRPHDTNNTDIQAIVSKRHEWMIYQLGQKIILRIYDSKLYKSDRSTYRFVDFESADFLTNNNWDHVAIHVYYQNTPRVWVKFYVNGSLNHTAYVQSNATSNATKYGMSASETLLRPSNTGNSIRIGTPQSDPETGVGNNTSSRKSFDGDLSNLLFFADDDRTAEWSASFFTELAGVSGISGDHYYDYRRHSKARQLTAYWKLNQANNQNQTNIEGNGDATPVSGEATITTTTSILPEKDYVDTSFSIMFWIKPDNFSGRKSIVSKYDVGGSNDDEYDLTLETSTGKLRLHVADIFPITNNNDSSTRGLYGESPALTAGVWNHVVAIYKASSKSFRFYINGTGTDASAVGYASSGATTSPNEYVSRRPTSTQVHIGCRKSGSSTDQHFGGKLHRLVFYKAKELSDSEVTNLYNSGKAWEIKQDPTYSDMESYFKLDSTFPSDVKGATTVASSTGLTVSTPGSSGSSTLDTVQDEDRSFTIAFWFKKDLKSTSLADLTILGKATPNATTNSEYVLKQMNRTIVLELIDHTGEDGASIINRFDSDANFLSDDTNTWEHIVITYTESNKKAHFYRNGSLSGNAGGVTGNNDSKYFEMQNTSTKFHLGAAFTTTPAADCVGADISNLLIFKCDAGEAPLTANQVAELYNSGKVYDYSTHSKASDLVLWWKLDENTGSAITDHSGKGNHGLDSGTSDVAQTASSPALQKRSHSDQPFSISFWAKATNIAATGILISKQDVMDSDPTAFEDLGEWALCHDGSTGNLFLRLVDPVGPNAIPVIKTYTFSTGVSTSAWKFFTIVYNPAASDKAVLYHGQHTQPSSLSSAVVGTAGGSSSYVSMRPGPYVTRIGGTPSQASGGTSLNGFKGHLSNMAIYRGPALTNSQVTDIFNAGYPHDLRELTTFSSAVAYWKLNETGSGAADALTGVSTLTASDFDGTRTGVTQTAAGSSGLAKRENVDIPFSAAFWIKKANLNANGVVFSKFADGNEYFLRIKNDGAVVFAVQDTTGTDAGATEFGAFNVGVVFGESDLNEWRHITVTFDPNDGAEGKLKVYKLAGTTSTLYEDDSNQANYYSEMQNTDALFMIGAQTNGTEVLEAHLSNLVIFRDHALTSGEVTEIQNSGFTYDYSLHSQAAKIVGWWKLDETSTSSGVQFADSSAVSPLTAPNNVATANGTTVGAIAANNTPTLQHREYVTTPITITAWIKPGRVTGDQIIAIRYGGSNANQKDFSLFLYGQKLRFDIYDKDTTTSMFMTGDVITEANKWYHIAMTYTPNTGQSDGGDAKFYIDGTEHVDTSGGNTTFDHPIVNAATPLRIGGNPGHFGGQYYKGNVANLLMWIHNPSVSPLSATEIQTIKSLGFCYNDASIPRLGEALGYWKFNDNDNASSSGGVTNHASSSLSGSGQGVTRDSTSSPDKYAYFYKTEQTNKFDYRKSNGFGVDFVDVDDASPIGAAAIFITSSRWPLDARTTFGSKPLDLSVSSFNSELVGDCFTYATTSHATRGEGIFQNDYSIFGAGANFQHGTPPPAPVYNRRVPQIHSTAEYLAGEAEWKAASQLGVNPFDTNFEEHATNFRQVGQDHSLVPEFIVSDHVEDVLLNGDGDFSQMSNRESFLSITGAVYHSSSQTLEVSERFYKTYGISDMMKYFGVTMEQVEDNDLGEPLKLTLRCKAALKFTPYRGFYPAERVQQITEMFSRGYMPEFDHETTATKPAFVMDQEVLLKAKIRANLQQSIKPLFAPGVLMNSIKSGMAVDYPLFTADNIAVKAVSGSASEGYQKIEIDESAEVNIGPNSIAYNGDFLAIGNHKDTSDKGKVKLYRKTLNTELAREDYTFVKDINNPASSGTNGFGYSVAMSDNYLAVGTKEADGLISGTAVQNTGDPQGIIYIWPTVGPGLHSVAGNASPIEIKNPDDPRLNCQSFTNGASCTPNSVNSITMSRYFGRDIKITDSYLFTTALNTPHGQMQDERTLYVWKAGHRLANAESLGFNGLTATDVFQRILNPDNAIDDSFANSFDFAPTTETLVASSTGTDSNSAHSGSVYIYEPGSNAQFAQKQRIHAPAGFEDQGHKFGFSVSISEDGQTLAVSQISDVHGSSFRFTRSGVVHMYEKESDSFVLKQTIYNPSESPLYQSFGYHIKVRGLYMLIETKSQAGTLASAPDRTISYLYYKNQSNNTWTLISPVANDLVEKVKQPTTEALYVRGTLSDTKIFTGPYELTSSDNTKKTIIVADILADAVDNYDSIKRQIPSPSKEFSPELKSIKNFAGSLVNGTVDTGVPRLSGSVYKRVTFEEMMNPDSLKGVSIEDQEPHPSASIYHADKYTGKIMDFPFKFGELDATNNEIDIGVSNFSLKKSFGTTMKPYRLAINNFCAETINFFLKDGKVASLETQGVVAPKLFANEVYKMRVEVINDGLRMYDRHSAFGPPVDEGDITLLSNGVSTKFTNQHAYSPFVPPFLDTDSNPYVDISFTPTETREHTLEEIIDGAQYTYSNFSSVPSNAENNTNYLNAMSLSASLKLDGFVIYESDNPDQGTTLNQRSRWVIQPRWETPVLNFIDSTVSALNLSNNQVEEFSARNGIPWQKRGWSNFYTSKPTPSSTPYLTSSVGMWHQAGTIPKSEGEGYTLRIQPHPDVTRLGFQLADKVGFTNENSISAQVGRLRDRKVVYEAVVAIPFIEPENSSQGIRYFDLPSNVMTIAATKNKNIRESLIARTSGLESSSEEYKAIIADYEVLYNTPGQSAEDSIAYQLRMFDKYIIPEEFRGKMMYVFQFSAEFTKQDLANIWQNVAPTSDFSAKDLRYSTVDNTQGISGISQDIQYVSNFLNKFKPTEEVMDFKNDKIRWIVLKVKQRAEFDLKQVKRNSLKGPSYGLSIDNSRGSFGPTPELENQRYSFNWPYDFFSIVELVKLEGKVDIFKGSAVATMSPITDEE